MAMQNKAPPLQPLLASFFGGQNPQKPQKAAQELIPAEESWDKYKLQRFQGRNAQWETGKQPGRRKVKRRKKRGERKRGVQAQLGEHANVLNVTAFKAFHARGGTCAYERTEDGICCDTTLL